MVEAINNTIEYAYGNGTSHWVDVHVNRHLHRIVFQVSDTGLSIKETLSPSISTRKI